jgi:hypothetical protein
MNSKPDNFLDPEHSQADSAAPQPTKNAATYEVLSHPLGIHPGINLDKTNQILDNLEVEEHLARIHFQKELTSSPL